MATSKVSFRNEFDIKLSRKFYRYFMLRKSYILYFVMAMGALCLVFLVLKAVDYEENKFQFIMYLTITLIGLVFMPFYLFFNIMSSASKDKKKRGGVVEIYEITKEKIQRSIEGVNQKYAINWMTLSSVVETSDAFYFFTSSEEAFIIAKKGLKEDIPLTTKIVIAQRISSIEDADQIIIMNDGRIDAIGTHEELLANNHIYQEVYYTQNKVGGDK